MNKIFVLLGSLLLVACANREDIPQKKLPNKSDFGLDEILSAAGNKDSPQENKKSKKEEKEKKEENPEEKIKLIEEKLKAAVADERMKKIIVRMNSFLEKGDPHAYELATIEVDNGIDNLDAVVQRNGLRMFTKDMKGIDAHLFPWQLKCGKYDKRIFHGCLEYELFQPKLVSYFDRGEDDPKKVDIFEDGGLGASVQFANIFIPWRFGRSEFYDKWHWGPSVGIGMSAAPGDAKEPKEGEEDVESSNAPIIVAFYGFKMRYNMSEKVNFGFELGRAAGFTTDESFSDTKDTATFVGLTINFDTGKSE